MANKKTKNINKNRRSPQTLKVKSEREAKARRITHRKKQSKDLDELAQTWDEDLCE